MLLIQYLTSVLCFVLLIHKGLCGIVQSTGVQNKGMTNKYEKCSRAVLQLLDYTAKDWHPLTIDKGYFPVEFYFIPDDDLINILASLETPDKSFFIQIKRHNSTQSGELAAEPSVVKASAAIIQNPFEIRTEAETDLHYSVKFVIRHPDGRKGTAKIVVPRTPWFKNVVMDIQKHIIGSDQLECPELLEDGDLFMQPKKDWNGITVKFYGKTFDVFNAQLILSSLVRWQNIVLPSSYVNESPWAKTEGVPNCLPNKVPSWFPNKIPEWFPSGISWAKTAGTSNWTATEAMLNDTMIILKDKDGKVVAQSPLPDHGSGDNEMTFFDIEYIKAATKIVNAYKKGMTFWNYSEE